MLHRIMSSDDQSSKLTQNKNNLMDLVVAELTHNLTVLDKDAYRSMMVLT